MASKSPDGYNNRTVLKNKDNEINKDDSKVAYAKKIHGESMMSKVEKQYHSKSISPLKESRKTYGDIYHRGQKMSK